MTVWKKWAAGTAIILLSTVMGIGIAYSSLKAGYGKVIKIAYMNGYVDAVTQDLEAIQAIKKDQGLLKKTVEASAENYVARVSLLNEEK